jgi:hypothetical protein
MKQGFLVGAVLGAATAIALGIALAVLPTTPTWTFWEIKRALDLHEYDKLRELIDFKSVAANAVSDVASNASGAAAGLDFGRLARALINGGKVMTVFNDPEHPVRLDWRQFVAAWWGMERDGPSARLHFDADGQRVTLTLGRTDDSHWRIVGLAPLGALLRVKDPPGEVQPRGDVSRAETSARAA